MVELVKVKRDGPRGWHLIAEADFDPSRHELWSEPKAETPEAPPAKEPKPKGRRK